MINIIGKSKGFVETISKPLLHEQRFEVPELEGRNADEIFTRMVKKFLDASKDTKYSDYVGYRLKTEKTENLTENLTRKPTEPLIDILKQKAKSFAETDLDGKAPNSKDVLLVDNIAIMEKTVFAKLIDGIAYPFYKMWLDIIMGTSNKLVKLNPNLFSSLEKIQDMSVFKKRAKEVEIENLYYQILGYAGINKDGAKSLLDEANANIAKGCGNYNSAHERALNRLATGAVSALFVGNDFYNVSMYQTDSKTKSEESGNRRFWQEIQRIGASAFLTYSVLSAFSKYTRGMAGAIVALVAAQSSTELISRLSSGMPIVPLTPEQAKTYQFKGLQKSSENDDCEEQIIESKAVKGTFLRGGVEEYAKLVSNQNNQNKTDIPFKSLNFDDKFVKSTDKNNDVNNAIFQAYKNNNIKADKKHEEKGSSFVKVALLSFVTVVGGGIIAAILKHRFSKFKNLLETLGDETSALKTAIADKNYMADKNDVEKFINAISDAGFPELATSYRETLANKEFLETAARVNNRGKLEDFLYKNILKFNAPSFAEGDKIALGRDSTWRKCITSPFDYITTFLRFPYYLTDKAITKIKAVKELNKLKELKKPEEPKSKYIERTPKEKRNNSLSSIRNLYDKMHGEMDSPDFKQKLEKAIFNSYNSETRQKYSSSDLAMYSRVFVTLISTYFFVNDFRNRVLIDSKGKDLQRASEVTNERVGQKVFNLFTNSFWMSLFNNAFHKIYQNSLVGAVSIAAVTEVFNETFLRKMIGVPILKKESREEIEDFEYKTYNSPGPIGEWTRKFSEATGKKQIGQREA